MARTQMEPMARPRRRKRSGLDKLALILLAVFLIVAAITAVVAFNMVRSFVQSWTITSVEGAPNLTQATVVNELGTPIPMDAPLQAANGPTAVPWDGSSRVTILVIGLDYRDWEAGGPPRSDTMMLITMDPLSKTAGMLSVPRDMWVNVPQVNTYAKINEAYRYGELYKLPGGGPALATETVRAFLGIPINYYAQIDFYAFEKFIDDIGGIDVTVDTDLKIDPLGKSNTINLTPGTHHLMGPAALGFARMRYTQGGDFDRADRQQQVVMAVRNQILKLNMLPNLVANAGNIYRSLSGGIRTNLSIDQALRLALFAQQIAPEKIKKGVLGPNEVEFAKSPTGLDILVPHPDAIRIVRDQVFTSGGPVSPAAVDSDALALAKSEHARVTLRNGSTTVGLASQTTDYLMKQGINIIDTNNADKAYTSTQIVVNGSTPYTAAYLAKLMNVPTGQILSQYSSDAKTDIIVVIGQDWARKNPMGTK